MKRRYMFLGFIIVIFSLFIRVYKLPEIPGEWFGDISNVHEYVRQILAGKWPFYFMQSPGPLYHYLIIPLVVLFRNQGYFTYKIASVVVSLLGLWGTYLLAKEVAEKKVAAATILVMAGSFWFLVWSRLGNSQIVIPALIAWQSYFTALYVRGKSLWWGLIGAIVASLGWYTYPQTFIFPGVFFLFLLILFIKERRWGYALRNLVFFILFLSFGAIPFVFILKHQPDGNFGTSGYVGGKVLPVFSMAPKEAIGKFLSNFGKYILEFHLRGDIIFRSNVPGHPHLDIISGGLMWWGFIYFLRKKRKTWLVYIILMLILLPIPSLSPALPDGEIPSSSRTIAVIPFVYLLIASGVIEIYSLLSKYSVHNKVIGAVLLSIVIFLVFYTNLHLYFFDYVRGLPDGNLAPGKIIASYVDRYPTNYALYFASCCWGQRGEPEPKGVVYVLRKGKKYASLTSAETKSCEDIREKPAMVIFGPSENELLESFGNCNFSYRLENIRGKDKRIVAKVMVVE